MTKIFIFTWKQNDQWGDGDFPRGHNVYCNI